MRRVNARFSRWLTSSLAAAALLAAVGCGAPIPAAIGTATAPTGVTTKVSPTNTPLPPPAAAASPTPAPPTPPNVADPFVDARVVEVVDGDTIRVAVGDAVYPVRYIGMDAPETDSRDDRLKMLAAEATAKNAELVAGKTVRLERDVSDTDGFGRLLRYVWVGDTMVNAELVRLGYAAAETYKPDVQHQTVLAELERRAQGARLGLWSSTQPVAGENTDLRSGPGTSYERIGEVDVGEALEIVAQTPDGDWVQLAGGAWILARLVSNPPGGGHAAGGVRSQQVELATQTPVAAPGKGPVEIVDLFRNGAKGQEEPDEYVEIRNLGGEPQDMTGWRLESERRQNDAGQVFHFPDGFVIEPGQKCRIYTDEDHPETCGLNFRHSRTAIWHNSRPDAALLFDQAGALVSKRQ